jgi:hypothetical protein
MYTAALGPCHRAPNAQCESSLAGSMILLRRCDATGRLSRRTERGYSAAASAIYSPSRFITGVCPSNPSFMSGAGFSARAITNSRERRKLVRPIALSRLELKDCLGQACARRVSRRWTAAESPNIRLPRFSESATRILARPSSSRVGSDRAVGDAVSVRPCTR